MSWVNLCYCLFVLKLSFCSVSATDTSCPTWHYYNSATGQCECGSFLFCSSDGYQVDISVQSCATSSGQDGDYYIGSCPFRYTVNSTNRMYSEMPSNASQLDEVMCGAYNRRGLLCGECKDGYGPAVYSIDLKCANCSNLWSKYAIFLYLILQFVPTTLIFIYFVVFRFDITSGPMLGYVLFCQALISRITSHYFFIYDYILYNMPPFLRVLISFCVTVSQFWTLQFFRAIIPPFCISEKLTGIHVYMLNLVPVIYPFVLVIILCVLMELHARNYRVVGILWKPIKIIFSKANIRVMTGDAVFHTFASFIFLSNVSVMAAAYQLVNFTNVHNSTGYLHNKALYIDPTIKSNDPTFIPYAFVAAVFFMFITVIPSLLLCIYPTRLYRYLAKFLSTRKQLAITAFAEALHNCFKDGLNETHDYRALAGSSLFFPLLFSGSPLTSLPPSVVEILLCMILICIVAYVKPCKSEIANASLGFHMTLFGILTCITLVWQFLPSVETYTLEIMFIIIFLLPHIMVVLWAGYTFTRRTVIRFGYQFHGPGWKVVLSDMANGVRVCLCKGRRGYQEMGTE